MASACRRTTPRPPSSIASQPRTASARLRYCVSLSLLFDGMTLTRSRSLALAAQYNLAKLLCHGKGLPSGPNIDEAIKWYRLSGEQGFVKANYNLGVVYFKVRKDNENAMHFFRLAAVSGFSKAQFNLGWMYHHVQGNTSEAAVWYDRGSYKQQHRHSLSFIHSFTYGLRGSSGVTGSCRCTNLSRTSAEIR